MVELDQPTRPQWRTTDSRVTTRQSQKLKRLSYIHGRAKTGPRLAKPSTKEASRSLGVGLYQAAAPGRATTTAKLRRQKKWSTMKKDGPPVEDPSMRKNHPRREGIGPALERGKLPSITSTKLPGKTDWVRTFNGDPNQDRGDEELWKARP
ncbi:hypothetical protein BC827DRAFT_1158845 [Russula dissimulans]|nr:hypothetical protein BC827DRAFT_1158845 [Russula dissimulans]